MALDFPNPADQTPANTFSPTSTPSASTNGVTYVWDTEKWVAADAATFLPIGGGTLTGDLTVPSLNGGQLAGFRNQIINGDFRIWQRGDGPWNTDLEYTADRWKKNSSGSDGVNFTKYTTLANLPEGFAAGIRCVVNGSDSSGGCLQAIELPGDGVAGSFIQNSEWTLSVWCDQDITGMTATARFGPGGVVDADTIGTFASTGETSNSFTRYFLNIDIGTAAPAAGHNQFQLSLTMHTQLGTTCIYTGVQLEPGPVATPFEHRPYGTELALCQRYYIVSQFSQQGNAITNGYVGQWVPFSTVMRTTPTVAITQESGKFPASLPVPQLSSPQNQGVRVSMLNNTGTNQANISYSLIFSADAEL